MKARRSNRCTSCSFLSRAPCSGGISFLRIALTQRLGADVLVQQQLDPVEQLGRGRLLLDARHLPDIVEDLERLRDQATLEIGEVHIHDRAHGLGVGELDVVEEAAAQEGVGQLLLVVGGDDDDGPVHRLDGLVRLVDVELHAVEFLQQVVGELDVGLVDLVDQQHGALVHRERLPQLALADVVADVGHPRVAELAVAQPAHGVVLVEALQGLGGRFDVPLDERGLDGLGHLQRQHRLAGAGLPLDQQRSLQSDGGVDGDLEILGCHIVFCALELHDAAQLPPSRPNDGRAYGGTGGASSRCRHAAEGAKGAPLPGGILEVAVCDALWGENAGKSVAAGPSNRRSCDLHEKSHGGGAVFSFVRRTV